MVSTFVTQSRIASFTASFSVAVPDVTLPDLGAEGVHAQDVRRLSADVLLAHEHDARQAQERAGGGRRDAVLAGAGLGDDPRLAEPSGEERLAEGVVDLVGARVGEVLALQVEADPGSSVGRRAPCRPGRQRRASIRAASASRSAR